MALTLRDVYEAAALTSRMHHKVHAEHLHYLLEDLKADVLALGCFTAKVKDAAHRLDVPVQLELADREPEKEPFRLPE